MGFLQFIFSLMFVIPVGLIMLHLIKRLNADMSEAVKREAKVSETNERKTEKRYGYDSRKYAPGYSKSYERPSMYNRPSGVGYSFGTSTAEIRRKELEEKDAVKSKTKSGILDKRKRRKVRKEKKKDK